MTVFLTVLKFSAVIGRGMLTRVYYNSFLIVLIYQF